MVPVKVLERIAEDLDLTKDQLVMESLKSEVKRRLATYKFTNHVLSKKYKMSFDSFERKKVIAKSGYSFGAEEDYHIWDQAIDGIKMLERDLKLLGN